MKGRGQRGSVDEFVFPLVSFKFKSFEFVVTVGPRYNDHPISRYFDITILFSRTDSKPTKIDQKLATHDIGHRSSKYRFIDVSTTAYDPRIAPESVTMGSSTASETITKGLYRLVFDTVQPQTQPIDSIGEPQCSVRPP